MKSLLFISLPLFLTACATTPFTPPNPPAAPKLSDSQSFDEAGFCSNRGGMGGIDCDSYRIGKAQLLDEQDQPQAGASFKLNGKTLQTDAQGNFPIPALKDLSSTSSKLEREGYWSYDRSWPLYPRFRLARKLPGEQDRYLKPFNQALLMQLNVRELFKSDSGKTLKDVMPSDTKTGYSHLELRTISDFDSLLKNLGEGNYTLSSANLPPKAGEAFAAADVRPLVEAALAKGQRLIAFTNNVFFRYQNMADHWFDTPEGHIISVNRSEVISYGGGSGHSYDIELLIFALPDPAKPVTFAVGKESLTVTR